jgi:chemosensory pili system protein ChpA (sensor histidine kinase/response regulator)
MATGNDPALGTGPVARKRVAIERKRQQLKASVSPPAEEAQQAPSTAEVEEGAGLEAEAAETQRIEAERAEAEEIEIEQREAEARELEELEAVTTGQS